MDFELFEKYLITDTKGEYLYIRDSYETYEKINILTDFFYRKTKS